MSSVTTWTRLEPLPRASDLLPGLRAEIADPLWLLARQRQFGEFAGEDAGSPIESRLTAECGRISRFHAGLPGGTASGVASDHTDADLPLETRVEQEAVGSQPGAGGLRVQAGLQFLRLLRTQRAAHLVTRYISHYAFKEEDLPGVDLDTSALRRAAVGRVPDGRKVFQDLVQARGNRPALVDLPPEPPVPARDTRKVVAAANAFLAWWDTLIAEPAAGPQTWEPRRLEYEFAIQADLSGGRVVLVADEYRGGRLDWYHFRAETQADLGRPARAAGPTQVTRAVIPTPVTYGGMPAERFWELEDASVRFGELTTGRTDLARLLLGEFALTYGNDWFVIPVDLPVGSVCRIERLEVIDTFGERTLVRPASEQGSSAWTMFTLSAPGAPQRVQGLLFLPPTLLEAHESEPLEEIAFFRDEMANVVWGVERTVQSEAGTAIDRYEEHQRGPAPGESQRVPVDIGDAGLVYRLQSHVPDHWHPFVPVLAGAMRLERRPIVRVTADGRRTVVEPKGRILRAATPLRIEEEEVPRSGAAVFRRFQLTRWTDGRTIVWVGRDKRTGRGEGSSGLAFDAIVNAKAPTS
jgi:hypothetical protein